MYEIILDYAKSASRTEKSFLKSEYLRHIFRYGWIPSARTMLEKSMPRPAFGGSRRPNRMDFSGQTRIGDFAF